jgi:hypothetical protein
MRRLLILAAAVLLVITTSVGAPGAARATAPVPKVAIIVGPAGGVTDSYRSAADSAAKAAKAAGAQVVKVYSPNATWDAVKAAVDGASIVVYLGHGNGWPSRYRDALYPPTQNGFGLNPVAGVDDSAHQYFGEASVEDLRLAPNAVVVLSHLCYASGNSEPGLPEGSQDDSIARVDNYASGFIRAGARAVIAEGHLGPAYYVKALLVSSLSVEQIWQRSPSAHGNTFAVASVRTSDYTLLLDPDHASGGYYRSLVSAGVSAGTVRAGAQGTANAAVAGLPAEPTLTDRGLAFAAPALRDLPIAGTKTILTLTLSKGSVKQIPKGAQVGLRWDPILIDPQVATPESSAPPVPTPGVTPDTPDSSTPAPGASPAPAASPATPPEIDLVVPEQLGAVVNLAKVKTSAKGLAVGVQYPAAPGLYRLVPTLHTSSGVAYDVATQELLTPLLVRVGGPVAVAYGAPATLSLTSGTEGTLTVRIVNAGSERWDLVQESSVPMVAGDSGVKVRLVTIPAHLVATWLSTDGRAAPAEVDAVLREAAAPGDGEVVQLPLTAPTEPGDYLLLLDVVSPSLVSILSHGGAPEIVRVTVTKAAPLPAPADPRSR